MYPALEREQTPPHDDNVSTSANFFTHCTGNFNTLIAWPGTLIQVGSWKLLNA
jgi:hypothetical protein